MREQGNLNGGTSGESGAVFDQERIAQGKKNLRRRMRERQKELPEAYVALAGEKIQEKILSMPAYAAARRVFLYVSMPKEPSTRRILRHALDSGKEVYVPKCSGGQMLSVRIRNLEDLRPGALGIPEPEDASETGTAEEMDLILVPCLSASADGRRLGHGAGYYDRFLGKPLGQTVCLCFEAMLCTDIPTDCHDVGMAQVITENS